MFDSSALRGARERNGATAEDRPSEVNEILEPRERVGYKTELPLLDRDYEDYPRGDDILRPEAGEALLTLAEHPLVSSAEDMADELNTAEGSVKDAATLHEVEIPEGGFEVDADTSRLDTLLGAEWPDGMLSSTNPITVATLYLKGLSVSEVADVLAEGGSNVPEGDVRQCLIDAGVLKGETTSEGEYRRKQNRGEVGGYDNGVTIDSTNL